MADFIVCVGESTFYVMDCCVGALLCCAIHQKKTYVCITMMCVILSKEINNSAALS